jgi:SynChlorMet cassette radical SAM/SPASM protein ScmE
MRSPRTVEISITSHCNLRCNYCYFYDNPDKYYEDLPTDEWLRFFEELGSLAVMRVCLAGGEPFSRPDFRDLVQGVVDNRMRFSVLSNGGLVTDDMAVFLAATGRCDSVQISLDSASEEEHDACRGRGSWKGAVRGIRTLQRHGISVAVRVTIHRHNYRNIDKTAAFILEDLGLPSFGTNSAGYIGKCRLNADDVLLTVAEREEVMRDLVRLAAQYKGRINASAGPLAEGRIWRKMEDARIKGALPFPWGGRLTSCGCAGNQLAVDADGSINPCNQLAHIRMGKINRDALSEIWLEHPEMNALRRRSQISLDAFEFCSGCEYIPYCTGNCPAMAYQHVGSIFHPSPDACLRQYLEQGGHLV